MRTDPLSFLGSELDNLRQQGLYRSLRILDGRQEATSNFDGRRVVNLSSNNYLGLTTHPDLVRRALKATEEFGVGSGSVRSIAGTMAIHMELERRLAAFKKTEAVVVFQSGFAANAGTVAAILTKDDVIISDELNHASIIDGCRLSKAADQGLSAQGRRRRAKDSAGPALRRSESCSSRTASSAWTAISERCPSCATSPKSSAAS